VEVPAHRIDRGTAAPRLTRNRRIGADDLAEQVGVGIELGVLVAVLEANDGLGRATRQVMGERDVEGR